MPKQIAAEDFVDILRIVNQHPDGVGIDALTGRFEKQYSKRTLQRRLSVLVEKGEVTTTGNGRSLIYCPAAITWEAHLTAPAPTLEVQTESYIPVSAEGQEVKDYVRQTIQQRKPIGYNPELLGKYVPNVTSFLSESLRNQLHKIGSPNDELQPAGTFARDILGRLLIDLSWASSRLEGNTYGQLDTQQLIEFGRAAEGKDALETQMILNHKNAIEMLVEQADEIGLNQYTLLNLHAILSDGLLVDPRDCGRLREKAVGITGTTYVPLVLPQKVNDQFQQMLDKAQAIEDPFEQAFFAMVFIPYLQPFIDVNKRVSRLVANIPLIMRNLCPLSFIDVPEKAYVDAIIGIYETNRVDLLRDVFIWAYERSCQQYVAIQQSLVPPDSFRLLYRQDLAEVVKIIVKNNLPSTCESVRASFPATLKAEDREAFIELVLNEIKLLHEGNIARFGLRLSEFTQWQNTTHK